MKNYYTIIDLKNHLMNQPIIKGEIRERVKKALNIPTLLDIHLKDNSSIALGQKIFAIEEKTIKKSLSKLGIEIQFPKKLQIPKEKIDYTRTYKEKSEAYKDLNLKRKEKNPDLLILTKDKKEIIKKEKRRKRNQAGLNTLNNYLNLINSDKVGLLFDIECNEKNQKQILEIGYVKFNKSGEFEREHIIVEEFYDVRNGKYVEDNKDNYDYGISKKMSLEKALNKIKNEIENCDFIIGHGINNDIAYLKKQEINIPNDKTVINTLKMTQMLTKDAQNLSIKNGLLEVGIKGKNFHNAGNDAYLNYELVKGIVRDYELKQILNSKRKKVINENSKKIKPKSFKI